MWIKSVYPRTSSSLHLYSSAIACYGYRKARKRKSLIASHEKQRMSTQERRKAQLCPFLTFSFFTKLLFQTRVLSEPPAKTRPLDKTLITALVLRGFAFIKGESQGKHGLEDWKKNRAELYSLKGQCHEIFDLYFFSLIKPIWSPDKQAKMVFLKNSFSRRYSNFFDKLAL